MQTFHGGGNETAALGQRVNLAFWEYSEFPSQCLLSNSAMVKLTPELLGQAPSALNPTKERQLDLRGEQ